jgi:hypothetical protein
MRGVKGIHKGLLVQPPSVLEEKENFWLICTSKKDYSLREGNACISSTILFVKRAPSIR